jgi:TolB protein
MTRQRWIAGIVGALWSAVATPLAAQEPPAILYTDYVYAETATSEIFTVVPGEEPVRLTDDDRFDLDPAWSPDRTRIAFVHQQDDPRNPDVWVMDADGSDKQRLTRGPRDDELPQWSPDGTRIAWVKTRGDNPIGRIFVMDADGSDKELVVRSANWPRWSPDGTRLAFMHKERCDCATDWEVRVVELGTGDVTALTDNRADDLTPVWSPDGGRIAFSRTWRKGGGALLTISPDGSGVERLTSGTDPTFGPDWSPDGAEIAFTVLVEEADFDTTLAVVDVATEQERRLTPAELGGLVPDWSPDGARIAFLGFDAGSWDVYVISPDGEGLEQVTDTPTDEGELDW